MRRIPETNFLQGITSVSGRDVQAILLRRRNQPSKPPPASLSLSSLVQSAFFGQGSQPPLGTCLSAPNICSLLPATRLVQKMTGVAVMAVTERLRGNWYGYGCEP